MTSYDQEALNPNTPVVVTFPPETEPVAMRVLR